ncbi:MAG: hypothetical protein CMM03_00700 [Rhodopirellula sp.]|nr:hypothetical protein [Rhodopirellula sp.]
MQMRLFVVVGLLLGSVGLSPLNGQDFVKSARVRAIVDKAIEFLESDLTGAPQMSPAAYGSILVGYTVYKYHDIYQVPGGKNHPKVVAGRKRALEAVADVSQPNYTQEKKYYTAAIAAIFFLDTDPDAHRNEIATLIDVIQKGQKKNGSWGYPGSSPKEGDNSVTQFVALALWMAKNRGFDVDTNTLALATNWFLRTQAPDGAWGYHGNDPGVFRRVSQEVKGETGGDNSWGHQSDAACGASSLYILAGTLQFINQKPKTEPKKQANVSSAVKLKTDDEKFAANPLTDQVDRAYLMESLALADRWFGRHFKFSGKSGRKQAYQNVFKSRSIAIGLNDEEPARWLYYSLYIYERYETFRALANEQSLMVEPPWYSRGVAFLEAEQRSSGNGSFRGPAQTQVAGPAMDTCFGLLFLMRSTLKSVSNLARDTQFISLGELPEDAANARIVDGKIVTTELGGDIGNLLDQLEGLDPEKFENMKKFPKVLELSADEEERKAQIARVKSMISEGAPAARRVAIRAYAREQGLDAVPILLYALTDPDVVATQEARNALRFISRRLNGFGLPDNPSPEEKAEAIAKWRNWYLQVRPEAELEEDGVTGVNQ